MRSARVVLVHPRVEVSLELVESLEALPTEGDAVELVEDRLVEPLADAVGLRRVRFGARVGDVLDGEVELVLVVLAAAELAAAVGEHADERNGVRVEERHDAIVEQVSRRQRGLGQVQLAKADLGVGVDEGLLVDAPYSLEGATVERVLRPAVARVLALELAARLLLLQREFERLSLLLGEDAAGLRGESFKGAKTVRHPP